MKIHVYLVVIGIGKVTVEVLDNVPVALALRAAFHGIEGATGKQPDLPPLRVCECGLFGHLMHELLLYLVNYGHMHLLLIQPHLLLIKRCAQQVVILLPANLVLHDLLTGCVAQEGVGIRAPVVALVLGQILQILLGLPVLLVLVGALHDIEITVADIDFALWIIKQLHIGVEVQLVDGPLIYVELLISRPLPALGILIARFGFLSTGMSRGRRASILMRFLKHFCD